MTSGVFFYEEIMCEGQIVDQRLPEIGRKALFQIGCAIECGDGGKEGQPDANGPIVEKPGQVGTSHAQDDPANQETAKGKENLHEQIACEIQMADRPGMNPEHRRGEEDPEPIEIWIFGQTTGHQFGPVLGFCLEI